MKHKWLWSYCICATAFAGGVLWGYWRETPRETAPQETVRAAEAAQPSELFAVDASEVAFEAEAEAVVPRGYLLQDNGGVIALYRLYSDDSRELLEMTDTQVDSLRAEDRALLRAGLILDTYVEALERLEDFCT